MKNVLEVRVVYDDGKLSPQTYTYTIAPDLDVDVEETVYVPMRGKSVKCKVHDVISGFEVDEHLDNLPYPKEKVIHLGEAIKTLLTVEIDDSLSDAENSFNKFIK